MSEELQGLGVIKVLAVVMALGGLVGWLAFRGHARRAIEIEARRGVVALGQGIARCAASAGPDGQPRGLPPSSGPVPSALAARRQTSPPEAWSAPAFSCAGFAPPEPLLYRFRWERLDPLRGVVEAQADLDGDGKADSTVSQPVECAGPDRCAPGRLEVH